MPTLSFTSGADTYDVTAAGTFDLTFLAGNDTLTTRHASATTVASMGDGADVVSHRAGTANVTGGAGTDRFEVYASGLTADGGADNDLFNIRGGTGLNLTGGLGNDRFNFYAASANILLHGGDEADDFFGYNKIISGSIHGDAGNDYFVNFIAGVTLAGGTGNDIYRANATNPATFLENAGEGIDSVQVARGASYILPANLDNISVQGFSGTTLGAATLTGNGLDNTINAHINTETIFGLGGNDRISAKSGDDTLYGGDGNDFLDGGPGNDTIYGEAGNDTLQGRTGDDSMVGGTGDDTYYVDSLSDVVTEAESEGTDIARVSVSNYTLTDNVETGIVFGSSSIALTGNGLNNLLIGNAGNDFMVGLDGNDTLNGAAADDFLYGGAGNDILNGGAGNDVLTGGPGDDSYYLDEEDYVFSPGDVVIEELNAGTDTVYVGYFPEFSSAYSLASNVENAVVNVSQGLEVQGNALNNALTGNVGADRLYGQGAADTLIGAAGDDELNGGSGDDTLIGGAGDDTLYGGSGADNLVGGAGGDSLWGGRLSRYGPVHLRQRDRLNHRQPGYDQ